MLDHAVEPQSAPSSAKDRRQAAATSAEDEIIRFLTNQQRLAEEEALGGGGRDETDGLGHIVLYEDPDFSPADLTTLYIDPSKLPDYAVANATTNGENEIDNDEDEIENEVNRSNNRGRSTNGVGGIFWYRPAEYADDADYFKSTVGCGLVREGPLNDAWLPWGADQSDPKYLSAVFNRCPKSVSSSSSQATRRISSLTTGDDCLASEMGATSVLRIGVVGLGAIGTICFTKLAGIAVAQNATSAPTATSQLYEDEAPGILRIAVDAFVKPHHFETLFNQLPSSPLVALHEKTPNGPQETATQIVQSIMFKVHAKNQLAMATDCANVRLRVLADSRTEDNEQPLDVVLVAVKAYDSASVIQNLQQHHAQLFKRDALFVLLQNGLGELPVVHASNTTEQNEATKLGDSWRFAHGVTYIGGRVLSFANVLVSGFAAAKTCVALVPGNGEQDEFAVRKMELLGRAMKAAGFQWERLTADDMKAMQWRKLIVNAGINPIASILNAPNKSVGACEWSRACVEAVVSEAYQVALREQVALNCTPEELVSEVLAVAANTGTNLCSMVADLRKGSKTEIEAITGRIVALGQRHNVATPANAVLLQLVKALEAQRTHQRDAGVTS